MSKIVAARLVTLGRRGVACSSAAEAKSWDIEVTFALGGNLRLNRGYKVRSLAIRELAALLAQARAAGLDARPMVRATCAPVRHLRVVQGGAS